MKQGLTRAETMEIKRARRAERQGRLVHMDRHVPGIIGVKYVVLVAARERAGVAERISKTQAKAWRDQVEPAPPWLEELLPERQAA
ncbi:hypothetical protein IV500_05130 [Paeniglutamicibacter antarcticus]|uniref:Uncharacterized protein n=1 Tax=Arthrobacter terrae TaxID=2935737 RepID=A0A931CHQ7_9MICC|nr:hypothetical protein [Arthrobacter terrae]MBG0738802.1 hypothetical protein [Arthrobacter terrae]